MSYGDVLLVIAGVLAALLLLAFPGYSWLLRLLVAVRGPRERKVGDATPPATLIISAFNEEDVIAEKLENALGIDYPDLALLVVSDASSDRTDAIVEEYARRHARVRLLRMDDRGGKTLGINRAMEIVETPIVVFTDANAMFESEAARRLIRNFADPRVGYVVGAALYSDAPGTTGARTEGRYWSRELRIKELESRLSSVVGADGAIYAIRRELFEPFTARDINDFVNPMQIISKGHEGVFEPEARCVEETTGSVLREIQRKRRIVNRSLAGLLRVREVLNPFRFGYFSLQVWLHKMLRWFGPMIGVAIMLLVTVASIEHDSLRLPVACVAGIGALLLLLPRFGISGEGIPILTEGIYAAGVSAATMGAIFDVARGRVAVTWQTRVAGQDRPPPRAATRLSLLMVLSPVVLAVVGAFAPFWIAVACLAIAVACAAGHSLIYALALRLACGNVRPREVEIPERLPDVTLLISAHNEEKVLTAKLENSIEQVYPGDLKIVVASDGSSDRTNEIAESFADRGVRLYLNDPRTGKAGMLRRASAHVETELVILSDANAMYEPDACARLISHFDDPTVGAVTGNVRLVDPGVVGPEEDVWMSRLEKTLMNLESSCGSCASIDGAMVAVRRDLIPEYEDGTILDDFVLAMHVVNSGVRVVYADNARGREWSVETLFSEYERRARIMAGIVQLYERGFGLPRRGSGVMAQFLGHKVWRWCAPWYAVSAAVIMVAMFGIVQTAAIGGILALALFAALTLLRGWTVATRKIGYLLVYQAAAIGGLARGLFGRQSGRWKRTAR